MVMLKIYCNSEVLMETRWSEWSNFHVTYATPPPCKTPFLNYTIIYIVKQRVIYVVFVSVYLLHLSPLIGTKNA